MPLFSRHAAVKLPQVETLDQIPAPQAWRERLRQLGGQVLGLGGQPLPEHGQRGSDGLLGMVVGVDSSGLLEADVIS